MTTSVTAGCAEDAATLVLTRMQVGILGVTVEMLLLFVLLLAVVVMMMMNLVLPSMMPSDSVTADVPPTSPIVAIADGADTAALVLPTAEGAAVSTWHRNHQLLSTVCVDDVMVLIPAVRRHRTTTHTPRIS